jgi:hypothetical protein
MLSNTRAALPGLLGLGALLLAGLGLGLAPTAAWAAPGAGTAHLCPPPSSSTTPTSTSASTTTSSSTTSSTTTSSSTTSSSTPPAVRSAAASADALVLHGPARSLGADPASGTRCPSGKLPFTGASVLPLLAAGLGLLAVGAAGVCASRRRGTARSG